MRKIYAFANNVKELISQRAAACNNALKNFRRRSPDILPSLSNYQLTPAYIQLKSSQMQTFTNKANKRNSIIGGIAGLIIMLFAVLFSATSNAQTTYFSKAAATDFTATASWGTNSDGSGTVPGSISNADNFTIANASAMTLPANAAVRALTINSGSLTITANTLTVSRVTGNNATMTVSGGTLNLSATGAIIINGNYVHSSGTVNQSGGSITIDGNDNNNAATSVASGTHLFALSTAGNYSGGTITIVDPPVNTYSTSTTRAITVSTSSSVNYFSGTHTFILGDGVSTTPGNTDGFAIETYASSAVTLRNVTVNGGSTTGRWATNGYGGSTSWGLFMSGNLTINSGSEFRTLSAANFVVGGNITNNGILTVGHTPGLTIGQNSNVTGFTATASQTVSGTGLFRNNNTSGSSTANFLNLIINNTGATGVTFSGTTSLLTTTGGVTNTGTVSGTYSQTAGLVNLSGGTFVLGESVTTVGTLSWTAGGFNNGSFKRWLTTTTLPTTLSASTPVFPFAVAGANRHVYMARSGAWTTAGSITATYNNASGLNTVSITDGAYTINRQTAASWSFASGDGINVGAQTFLLGLNGDGTMILAAAPGTAPRLCQSAAAVQTHVAGTGSTSAPIANRSGLTLANLTAAAHFIGVNTADLGVFTIQSGNWENGSTWSTGSAPISTSNVTILIGHTVTVNAAASLANTLLINGTLTVSGSTLGITAGTSATGVTMGTSGILNISGGTTTIGTGATRFSRLTTGSAVTSQLNVTGGNLNINGNLVITSPSTFTQTLGTITIDGNAAAVTGNSVPSGSGLLEIRSVNISLSGGTVIIVDPHAATTASTTSASFYGNVATATNIGTGHTIQFGDGTSTDNGGSTNGFLIYTFAGSSYVQLGTVMVSGSAGGTNRQVLTSSSVGVLGNLTVSSAGTAATATGEFRIGASSLFLNGNLTVNSPAAFTSPASSVLYLADFSNANTTTPNNATGTQTIGGTGVFRNNTTSSSSTASFTGVTIRNANASATAVTFSGNALFTNGVAFGGSTVSNSGTASGTLNLISGNITTGAGTFILGVTGTNGTLSYTGGGFTTGSTFARQFATTNLNGTTIAASTTPSASGAGTYPFITGANSRFFYLNKTLATTAGAIAVKYTDGTGVNTISAVNDGGYSIDRQSNVNWQVTTPTINAITFAAGAATFDLAAAGTGSITVTNTNGRLMQAAAVVGTNQAGTTAPLVQRITIPAGSFIGTYYIGLSSSDVPVTSTAIGGAWESGASWVGGSSPSGCTPAIIQSGATITVNTTPVSAGSVLISSGGTLAVSGSSLTVGCTLNNSPLTSNGTLNVSGGTININGNLAINNGSTFIQSGGDIIVDGNNGGSTTGSVAAGVNIVSIGSAGANFATGTLNLTGGNLIIVDPHTQTTAAASTADGHTMMYWATNGYTAGLNHTLKFGNGSSTDAGGSSNQFDFTNWGNTGVFVPGKLIADAGNGVARFVNFTYNPTVGSDLTVNSGTLSVPVSTANVTIGGNFVNNGTAILSSSSTGALFFASVTGTTSVVSAVSTIAQSVSGTGVYRNTNPSTTITAGGTGYVIGDILTVSGGAFTTAAVFRVSAVSSGAVTAAYCITPGFYTGAPTNPAATTTGGSGSGCTLTLSGLVSTANFTNLIVNNNSSAGVNFSDANSLLSGINIGTVSGTLTFTQGYLNTGSNTLRLGTSASSVGTLSYTAGGFGSGSTFSRWFAATTGGSSISNGSNPSGNTGRFPFISGTIATQADRSFYVNQTTAASTGGLINVKYNDASTLSTVSIVDGVYTSDRRTDANWVVSQTGITGSSAYSIAAAAPGYFTPASAVSRLSLLTLPAQGTHAAGSPTTLISVGQRTALALTDLPNTYYISIANADIPFFSAQTGDWNTASTWNKNAIPGSTDAVVIQNSHTVTVSGAASANSITVNSGGVLTLSFSAALNAAGILSNAGTINANAGTFAIIGGTATGTTNTGSFNIAGTVVTQGPIGGGNTVFNNTGTLAVSSGTLNLNGSFIMTSGALNQSGGNINIDGNSGTTATSVASGTHLFSITGGTPNCTAGNITIVDPHDNTYTAGGLTNNSVNLAIAANNTYFSGTHTFIFGDGVSTTTGNADGFVCETYRSGAAPLQNVIVNGGSASGRWLSGSNNNSTAYGFLVKGNLTVNSGSEFRTIYASQLVQIGGSLINNGTFTFATTSSTSALTFGNHTVGSFTAVAASSISGSGIFRNSVSTSTAAGPTFLTVNNSNGLTLSVPLTVSNTLTMTNGIITTSSTNLLSLGTASAAGTLSGTNSATNMIVGPFACTFAASRTATGSTFALFPVGKGSTYLPISADPITTAGGAVILTGEAFIGNSGTPGSGVTLLGTNRWALTPTTGSAFLTSSYIRLGDALITSNNKILQASANQGTYNSINGITTYAAGTPNILTSGSPITPYTGYFTYGNITPCTAPVDQPSAILVSNKGGNSFDATFSAAPSSPTGYVVVRYLNADAVTDPSNLSTYTVGASIGLGTVVLFGNTLGFSDAGLTANTTYKYIFYSYNNGACAGPTYNLTTPYSPTVTTCAAVIGVPGTPAASLITISSFTATWTASSTSGVDYILDVATDNAFTNFVTGYNGLNVGTGTLSKNVNTNLSSSTTYYVRVRALLSGCYSLNSGTLTTATACGPATLPYSENFNSVTPPAVPVCTLVENNSAAPAWITNASPALSGFTGNVLDAAYNSTIQNNTWFFTPGFNLTAGTTYVLSYRYGSRSSSFIESMKVAYGTGQLGTSMTNIIQDYPANVPATATVDTKTITPASTGVYYIGFQCYSLNRFDLYLDDITLTIACTAPTTQASVVNFPSTGSSNINGSFTAAAAPGATGYLVIRTAQGVTPNGVPANGTFYNTVGAAFGTNGTVVSSGTGTTFTSTGLAVSTTYRYTVYSYNAGCGNEPAYNTTTPAFGESTTLPAQNITSATSGFWSQGSTWQGGTVPSINDNVRIFDGHTVTIDVAAFANSLQIGTGASGVLIFEATTARTLTVATNVSIFANASFLSAATGTQTGHILSVGGNITNDPAGIIDFSTNTNTAGARITFTGGAANTTSTFTADGTVNLRAITVNKGTDSTTIINITGNGFSVRGTTTDDINHSFVTLTSGTLKLSMSAIPTTSRLFSAGYTIPAAGGLWLNSSPLTVSGQSATTVTNNGLLRITAGILNVGTASGNSMTAGTGASFHIEGGSLNVAGGLTSSSDVSYWQTGGNVTVNTVGYTASSVPAFGFTSVAVANKFVMSDGTITLQKASTATTPIDYRQGGGTVDISGGDVLFGNATTASNTTFIISNNGTGSAITAPNISTLAGKNITLNVGGSGTGPLQIYGGLYVNALSTLTHTGSNTAGQQITLLGNIAGFRGDLQNSGVITNTGSVNNVISMQGGFGSSIIGGSGTMTYPTVNFADPSGITLLPVNNVILNRMNLYNGCALTNANKVTLGTGGASSGTIGIGGLSYSTPAGSIFSGTPTLNVGTGGMIVRYDSASNAVTTGLEIPASRVLSSNLVINNRNGVTMAGGNLSTATLTLTAGNLTTDASDLLTVTGTATTNVSRSSYTSAAGATNSGTTITVTSTSNLVVGMSVTVKSGTGVFNAGTYVTGIPSSTTFVVSAAPTTALSASAVVTGSGGWVNGPMERALPASVPAGSTYLLPVGKTAYAGFALVNPVTTTAATVRAEYFTAASGGTPINGMQSLYPGYWETSSTGGFTSSVDSVTSPFTLNVGTDALAKSDGANNGYDGNYDKIGTAAITTTTVKSDAPEISLGFYALGVKAVPMTYVSSTTTTLVTGNIYTGTINQQIIGVQVVTTGNFPEATFDAISFSANALLGLDNGSSIDNITTNVDNAKLYFTGSSPVFSAATQVGTSVLGADMASPFSFIPSTTLKLEPGTNYFWLTYDVPSGAQNNDSLDAKSLSLDITEGASGSVSTSHTPTVTDPTGNGTIKTLLSGDYTIGTPTALEPNYPSLTSAIAALNSAGVGGPVRFLLQPDAMRTTAETFPLVISEFFGASAVNTLTILPNTGVTATITSPASPAATSVIKLNGADYVIIDGSNNGTTSRNLTISNLSTSTSSTVVWIASATASNGATNDVVKNAIVTGNASTTTLMGIFSGGTASVSTSGNALVGNSSLTIQNNKVSKAQYGIYAIGVSTSSLQTGLAISNNDLGSATSGDGFILEGIDARLQTGAIISNNNVQNVSGASSINPSGINLVDSRSSSVSGNKVFNLNYTGTSTIKLWGITTSTSTFNVVGTPSSNTFSNNMVYGLTSTATSSVWNVSGINNNGGYNDKYYFNTVHLTGAMNTSGTGPSAAFSNGNSSVSANCPVIDIRNNIFSMAGSSAGTPVLYSHFTTLTTYSGSTISNNDLYSVVTGTATAQIGGFNSVNYSTLAAWQTATTKDANSKSVLPVFVSATDLHLTTAASNTTNLVGTGIAGTGITTDIDAETRSTPPGIGADELAPCSGAVSGTAVAPSTSTFCGSSDVGTTITASGYSSALNGTYIWQSSTTNVDANFADISGATNPASYIIAPALNTPGTMYYRLKVTCTSGLATATSNVIPITINAAPTSVITPVNGLATICTPTIGGASGVTLNGSTNEGSPAYQWKLNGVNIDAGDGGTAASYVVPNGAVGSYTLVVAGSQCSTTSTATVVGTAAKPTATATATPTPLCLNSPLTLTSTGTAAASGPITDYTVAAGTYATADMSSATALVTTGVNNSTSNFNGSLDDGGWNSIPLGFSFSFYGNTYSSLSIGTNGNVQFGAGTTTATTYPSATGAGDGILPNTVLHNFIAAPWLDAVFSSTTSANSIKYLTTGVTGNRKFIVEWNGQIFLNSTDNYITQLVLNEASGNIEVHFQQLNNTTNEYFSIGVQNSASVYTAAPGRNSVAPSSTAGNEAWIFTPVRTAGSIAGYSWAGPAGSGYSANVQNPLAFNVAAANAGQYVVTVTDGNGCKGTASTASVVVNPLPTITTAASATGVTRNFNSQTTPLTYSATTAAPISTYSIDWNAAAEAAGLIDQANVPFTASPLQVTVPGSTDAGTYTGVLTVTNSNACPSNPGNSFTLTVVNGNPVWTGGTSTNWNTGSNWSTGLVPVAGASVTIDAPRPNYPVLTGPITVGGSLDLAPGSRITIGSNTLTVTGGILADAGVLVGSNTSNLTLGANSTVKMAPAGTLDSSLLHNLVVNAGTTTLASPMNITGGTAINTYGTVTVAGSAILASAGKLTFKSNAFGTARLEKNVGASNFVTGNVTVERYIPANAQRAWRFLSVPTKGSQTINQAWQDSAIGASLNPHPTYANLITTRGNLPGTYTNYGFDAVTASTSLITFNTPGNSWTDVTSTLTPIETTSGYSMYVRGDRGTNGQVSGATTTTSATTLRTTGTLYTGDQSSITVTASKLTFVGNTYVSPIDFPSLTKVGVANSFYVWDPKVPATNGTRGAYVQFSGSTITPWQPSVVTGSYTVPNQKIETGTAFLVTTSAAVNGSITLTEGSKVAGAGTNVYRPSSNRMGIIANLYTVAADNSTMQLDATQAVFDDAFSNNIDGDDAPKVPNSTENIAVRRADRDFFVEGRSLITELDTSYLQVWNTRLQQQYKLELNPVNMVVPGLNAWIVDNYLHTSTQLDLTQVNNVAFTISSDAASADRGRFKIVYKQAPAGPLPVTFISISANKTGTGIKVDWKVAAETRIQRYEVQRSVDGNNFVSIGTLTAAGNSTRELDYSWTDATPLTGNNFYRIKSVGAGGEIKYTYIVKVLIGDVKQGYTISPNPVEGSVVNVQFKNQPQGRYNIRLLSTGGEVIFTSIADHAGGNSTQLLNLPGVVARGAYQLEIIAPDKTKNVQNLFINTLK